MADLDFVDVLIVSAVASVGLTLLFFWYSAIMMRRNWSYQVRPKGPKGAVKGQNPVPSETQGADAAR